MSSGDEGWVRVREPSSGLPVGETECHTCFFLSASRSARFQSKPMCTDAMQPVDLLWEIFYNTEKGGETHQDLGRQLMRPEQAATLRNLSSVFQSETMDAGNFPRLGVTNDNPILG